MFRPYMGHHQATPIIRRDHYTVHFVLSILRHIVIIILFFLISIMWVESILGPLGTSATNWPIVPAPGMENLVERRLSGETEILEENLPQRHFAHHKSHLTTPGREPGPQRREVSDYPLELWRGML
jgi:hypothetical protein